MQGILVNSIGFQPTPVEARYLAAVFLCTDGCITKFKYRDKYQRFDVKFISKDWVLIQLFVELMQLAYNTTPSNIEVRANDVKVVHYKRIEHISVAQDILKLTRNFTSLEFLNSASLRTKLCALRIALSCEGSVHIKNDGGIQLTFGCTNPILIKEWHKFFQSLGLIFHVVKSSRTRTGFHSLRAYGKDVCQKFLQIGGFLPIKVHRGRYKGKLKNEVLQMVVTA